MANIDNTLLWSDDPAKFDEITAGLTFNQGDNEMREPGKLYFRCRGRIPHEAIKEFSAKHPDMTFYAEHSFEYDWWSEVHTVEYKAGESRQIGLKPAYSFISEPGQDLDALMQDVPKELEAKATEIFKRVDRVINDPDKGMFIDWCKDEITVTVEHDGYRMQATKIMNEVGGIKLFKAHEIKNVEWRQIHDTTMIDGLPF